MLLFRMRHEKLCRSGTANFLLSSVPMAASVDKSTKPTSGNSLELPISVNNYKHMASSAVHMKVLDDNGRKVNMFSCVICSKLLQVSPFIPNQ